MNDMNWWAEYGPYMAIAMAAGAFILLRLADRMVQSYRAPKNMSEWYPELERAYMCIVHKNRELLEAVAEAEQLKKNLPDEYKAILDQVIMLARLVEQSSYENAVANGLVPRSWLGGSGEQPVMIATPVEPIEPPEGYGGPRLVDEMGELPTSVGAKVVQLPGIASEWIRTQVLRNVS